MSKQKRTNPKQLFLLVPDPRMCVMRKKQFTGKQGHTSETLRTSRLVGMEGHASVCYEAVTDTTMKHCGVLLSDGQDNLFTMGCTTVHVFAG